jgi:hypothetical protein
VNADNFYTLAPPEPGEKDYEKEQQQVPNPEPMAEIVVVHG